MRRIVLAAAVSFGLGWMAAGTMVEADQKAKGCKPVPVSAEQMRSMWPSVRLVHEPDGSESIRVTIDERTAHGAYTFECR